MRTTARRIRDGQALAEAMAAYPDGMTLTGLARKTRELDPAWQGVSFQLIGLLRSPSTSGVSGSGPNRTRRYRVSTTPETADLIEDALNVRRGTLFNREQVAEPGDPPPESNPVPEVRFRVG